MMRALDAPGSVLPDQRDGWLQQPPRGNAAERLQIYQRSYVGRLVKCLAEQSPAVCHALGEELFEDFCRQYLRAHPPSSHTLHDVGHAFAAWLEGERPDRDSEQGEEWIDFLVDLARYERQLFDLFDACGSEGQSLPTHETPDEDLVLQPSVVLARYRYPVAAYHHAVRAERSPGFPPQAPSAVALVRRDFATTTLPIHQVHWHFLIELGSRGSVAEAIESVAETVARPATRVLESWPREVLSGWIEAGLFGRRSVIAAVSNAPELLTGAR